MAPISTVRRIRCGLHIDFIYDDSIQPLYETQCRVRHHASSAPSARPDHTPSPAFSAHVCSCRTALLYKRNLLKIRSLHEKISTTFRENAASQHRQNPRRAHSTAGFRRRQSNILKAPRGTQIYPTKTLNYRLPRRDAPAHARTRAKIRKDTGHLGRAQKPAVSAPPKPKRAVIFAPRLRAQR